MLKATTGIDTSRCVQSCRNTGLRHTAKTVSSWAATSVAVFVCADRQLLAGSGQSYEYLTVTKKQERAEKSR
jgi:hypothetical protein